MGDDIRRFYMQVSGEEFSLESAKLWERAKDTFFGIEVFHFFSFSFLAFPSHFSLRESFFAN